MKKKTIKIVKNNAKGTSPSELGNSQEVINGTQTLGDIRGSN